jgi:hypothetical protein
MKSGYNIQNLKWAQHVEVLMDQKCKIAEFPDGMIRTQFALAKKVKDLVIIA